LTLPEGKRTIYGYKEDQEAEEYIANWVKPLNLLCRDDAEVGLLGAAFFIGLFVALFFLPQVSDRIGRKKVFLWTMVLTLILQVVIWCSHSLYLTMGAIFGCGMLWVGKNIVGLSYAEEMIHKQYSNDLMASLFVVGAVCMFCIPLFFLTITKSWQIAMLFSVLMTLFCLAILPWYMPESPKYLYEKRDFEGARASLRVIAARNGVSLPDIKFDKENSEGFDGEEGQVEFKS